MSSYLILLFILNTKVYHALSECFEETEPEIEIPAVQRVPAAELQLEFEGSLKQSNVTNVSLCEHIPDNFKKIRYQDLYFSTECSATITGSQFDGRLNFKYIDLYMDFTNSRDFASSFDKIQTEEGQCTFHNFTTKVIKTMQSVVGMSISLKWKVKEECGNVSMEAYRTLNQWIQHLNNSLFAMWTYEQNYDESYMHLVIHDPVGHDITKNETALVMNLTNEFLKANISSEFQVLMMPNEINVTGNMGVFSKHGSLKYDQSYSYIYSKKIMELRHYLPDFFLNESTKGLVFRFEFRDFFENGDGIGININLFLSEVECKRRNISLEKQKLLDEVNRLFPSTELATGYSINFTATDATGPSIKIEPTTVATITPKPVSKPSTTAPTADATKPIIESPPRQQPSEEPVIELPSIGGVSSLKDLKSFASLICTAILVQLMNTFIQLY